MIELTVQIIGHLGADSKLITSEDAEKRDFVSFPVYAELYEGQKLQGIPHLFEVTTGRVNLQPYLKKGTRVYVTGRAGIEIAPTKDHGVKLSGRCWARQIELLSAPVTKSIVGDTSPEAETPASPIASEEKVTYPEDELIEDFDSTNYFY